MYITQEALRRRSGCGIAEEKFLAVCMVSRPHISRRSLAASTPGFYQSHARTSVHDGFLKPSRFLPFESCINDLLHKSFCDSARQSLVNPFPDYNSTFFRQHRTASYISSGHQSPNSSGEPPPVSFFFQTAAPTIAAHAEGKMMASEVGRFSINQRKTDWFATEIAKERFQISMVQYCLDRLTTTTTQSQSSPLPIFIQFQVVTTNSPNNAVQ